MSMDSQLATFVITIVTGAVLGCLFDFYRVVRGALRLRWASTALADLLFWLTATALVFAGLIIGNWGEMRLYVFFGLAGGVVGYYRLCSRWAVRLFAGLVRLAARLARAVRLAAVYIFVKPLRFCGRLAGWPVRYIGGKFAGRRPPPEEPRPPV